MRDPYEVLGVPRDAELRDIRRAWRRIARETHPDLHGDDPARVARFREATEAWAILSDPDRRRRYDRGDGVDAEALARARDEILAAVAHVRAVARAARGRALRAALVGLAWLAAGVGVTAWTWLAAAPGESYTIWYGAMIVGVYQAGRGVEAFFKIRRIARDLERELWAGLSAGAGPDGPPPTLPRPT